MKDNINDFINAYIDCALWSSFETDLPEALYSLDDISPSCKQTMHDDCVDFLESFGNLIDQAIALNLGYDSSKAGHDFWLTRNGHGAGFWDRSLGDIGDELTTVTKHYGSCELYVGDDGLIYC